MEQAVILCGGKGTRLGELTKTIPKPLLPVGEGILLDRTIRLLAKHGVKRVLLMAGHLGEQIEEHYSSGSYGEVGVTVFQEPEALGTSGGLRLVEGQLDESFLLVYGDVFVDFDVTKLIEEHLRRVSGDAVATLMVRPSDHPWDSHLVDFSEEGWVREFVFKQEEGRLYKNWGNVAIYACQKKIIRWIPEGRSSDFGKDVFPAILDSGGKLGVSKLEVGGFVRDMGTPDRLSVVEEYLGRRDRAERAQLYPKKLRVALLDRDGTLNVEKGHLGQSHDLELLPGVGAALKDLVNAGWDCYVITNQPGIARGEFTKEELRKVHQRLVDLVEMEGGVLKGIYYSPFHPETHYGEGVKELRRASDCRKPNSGMLFQAAEEHDLDLAECVMIGDSWRDIQAGQGAGVRTIYLGNSEEGDSLGADWTADSLPEAVRKILLK